MVLCLFWLWFVVHGGWDISAGLPVVGAWWVHDKQFAEFSVSDFLPAGSGALFPVSPDTLLGPEATGSAAPIPGCWGCGGAGLLIVGVCPGGWGVVVVAPSWWWGVVFDLWIVVASIKSHVLSVWAFGFRVGGVCGLLWCNFSCLFGFVL